MLPDPSCGVGPKVSLHEAPSLPVSSRGAEAGHAGFQGGPLSPQGPLPAGPALRTGHRGGGEAAVQLRGPRGWPALRCAQEVRTHCGPIVRMLLFQLRNLFLIVKS